METKKTKKQKITFCEKEKRWVPYDVNKEFWDYSGSGYNTKIVLCPYCNTPIILDYEEEDWLKNGF